MTKCKSCNKELNTYRVVKHSEITNLKGKITIIDKMNFCCYMCLSNYINNILGIA